MRPRGWSPTTTSPTVQPYSVEPSGWGTGVRVVPGMLPHGWFGVVRITHWIDSRRTSSIPDGMRSMSEAS